MNRMVSEKLKIPESVRIPFFGGRWYSFLCRCDNRRIREETLPSHPLNTEPRAEKVIVSLTSFPGRIGSVHLAIKSLMLQSYRPDRIQLWLAQSQFPDCALPGELRALEVYGLEILFCEENLLGHKKHWKPISAQLPHELVVTYDDDIIYPPNSLEKLIRTHEKFPDCVVCNRAQALVYEPDGNVKNPGRWQTISDVGVGQPTYRILPSNGGGVLYPYHALSPDSYNAEKIRALALCADDLWMMFMALDSGCRMVKTVKYHRTFSVIGDTQKEQLATDNIGNGAYLVCLQRLIDAYPAGWHRCINNQKYI